MKGTAFNRFPKRMTRLLSVLLLPGVFLAAALTLPAQAGAADAPRVPTFKRPVITEEMTIPQGAAPTNVVVKSTVPTQVEVSWAPVQGAGYYVVTRFGPGPTQKKVVGDKITINSFIDKSAMPNTQYYYEVSASYPGTLADVKLPGRSPKVGVLTPRALQPKNISVEYIPPAWPAPPSFGIFRFTWDAPPGATNYQLYRNNVPLFKQPFLVQGTNYTDRIDRLEDIVSTYTVIAYYTVDGVGDIEGELILDANGQPTNVPGVTVVAGGRFRVTINGFKVIQETADNPLQFDGKGDEVFVAASAYNIEGSLGSTDSIKESITRRSKIYGDTNGFNDRVKAGSRSSLGGLKTGDHYPEGASNAPWRRKQNATASELPMVVWEGTLRRGRGGILIIPTIWEHDGDDGYYEAWKSTLENLVNTLRLNAPSVNEAVGIANALHNRGGINLGAPYMEQALGSVGLTLPEPFVSLNAKNRPIGLTNSGFQQLTYRPAGFLLTYDRADAISKSLYSALNGASSDFGIFSMEFSDPGGVGKYKLYLQIERLP